MDDLIFYTGNSYLKRSMVHKRTVTSAPGSYVFGDIEHNLGYVPAVRTYYQINGNLIESYGNMSANANIPAFNNIYMTNKIRENTVRYAISNSGNVTRTVTIIVVVYLDDVA